MLATVLSNLAWRDKAHQACWPPPRLRGYFCGMVYVFEVSDLITSVHNFGRQSFLSEFRGCGYVYHQAWKKGNWPEAKIAKKNGWCPMHAMKQRPHRLLLTAHRRRRLPPRRGLYFDLYRAQSARHRFLPTPQFVRYLLCATF